MIDSAHIPQIVIAAIIIFNIHSALKNLKKSAKSHKKNFFCNVLVRRVRMLKNEVKNKRFFFDNPKLLSRE